MRGLPVSHLRKLSARSSGLCSTSAPSFHLNSPGCPQGPVPSCSARRTREGGRPSPGSWVLRRKDSGGPCRPVLPGAARGACAAEREPTDCHPPGRPFPGQVGVCGKGPRLCWQSVGAHSEQHTGPGHAEPALPSCCLSAAPWGLSPELPAISWGGGGGQVFGRSTGTSLHLHCHTHPTPGKTSPPTKRACPCVQGGPPGHLLPREPPAWAWTEPALGAEVLMPA